MTTLHIVASGIEPHNQGSSARVIGAYTDRATAEAVRKVAWGSDATVTPVTVDEIDGEIKAAMGALSLDDVLKNCPTTLPLKNDVVAETLVERIQRQQRLIDELRSELQDVREASVVTMLGQLRLREALLLYVGQDTDTFVKQLAENFGSDIARAVSNSLFVLENAPVSRECREAIRQAANHGMNRW